MEVPSIRLACFWPGLAGAWYRGIPSSAAIAVIWAWALIILLLATFIWPQWFEPLLVKIAWAGVFVVWLVSSVRSHLSVKQLFQSATDDSEQEVAQAQEEYLKGNWFEAEAMLLEVVHRDPRDAESLLLLVGVLRHTRRLQPAIRRLEQLERLDSASRWRYEISRERQLIEQDLRELAQADEALASDAGAVSGGESETQAAPN